MTPTTPCYRHSRTWIAACRDCTEWHLAAARARRDAADRDAVVVPSRPLTTARLRLVA